MKSHSIFGVSIDDISADELTSQLSGWLEEGRGRVIVTPNAEMLLFARHDALFQKQLNSADLRLPDAVSLRYAVAALTDDYLQHRHTGVDTLTRIATLCARQEKRLLLLGGDPGSAQQAAERMKRSQDSLGVHAIDPGVLVWDEGTVRLSSAMEELILQIEPDVIAVALGQRKQETFMQQYRKTFPSVKMMIGVGGAFEMLSGQKKRSPKWMRSMGLELRWRVLIEPRRIGRIIRASVVFPLIVVWQTLRQKRFVKAIKRVIPEVLRQLSLPSRTK